MDEASLIARVVLDTDHHAFGQLVRLHQSALRSFLRRLTAGDAALADDIAQETLIKAFRFINTFRNQSKFRTWLFGIAVNLFKSEKRKKRWQAEVLEAPKPQAAPGSLEDGVLGNRVVAALGALGENERIAITLCTAAGLSHSEAAVIMDIPVGTVKTHVNRGKQKLQASLGSPQEMRA